MVLGHIDFPTVLEGKGLLCPTEVNQLMSIVAHDGPSDSPNGHFSSGSIKLGLLPVSPWVLPQGKQLLCLLEHRALYRQLFAPLVSAMSLAWPTLRFPDRRMPWEDYFAILAFTVTVFRLPVWANLSHSQHCAASRGGNDSCEKESCFLQLSSTWELFENNNASHSLV